MAAPKLTPDYVSNSVEIPHEHWMHGIQKLVGMETLHCT